MRIGLLGAARIAPRAVIDPAREIERVTVAAVAARDVALAEVFAREHGIATVHADYESLLADETLDAVYIGLPNSAHAAWSIAALQAGRHVLVEKPFASNATEAAEMVAAAERTGKLLVEAFHWRYHPLATRLLEIRDRIGVLVSAEAEHCGAIPHTDIRYRRELGGGATMDLGCYAIHWLRTLAGEEPVVERAMAVENPAGIDEVLVADLRFPSGAEARVRTSMAPGEDPVAFLRLEGEGGSMEVVNPVLPHNGNRVRAHLASGEDLDEVVEGGTTYFHQLEAFLAMVEDGRAPLTGGADAIGNMTTIDAAYTAAGMQPRNTRPRE
jgi:predicted dehydrogenase